MKNDYAIILFEKDHYFSGKRITLRSMKLTDAADMYAYCSQPEVIKYVTFPIHETIDETRKSIANFFLAAPLGKFAIEHNSTKKMIGTLDIRIDQETASAEIGYILNPDFQGQGYMTEAGNMLLEIAFNLLELQLVHAYCDSRNDASRKTMERLGMKYDGRLRGQQVNKQETIDTLHYSITKSEYLEN